MTEAYPLQWPEGWPRTPHERRMDSGRFNVKGEGFGYGKPLSQGAALSGLVEELGRLKAKHVVISSNIPVKKDGFPYADVAPKGREPGIAVYFTLKDRQMVIACDRYRSVAANMRSVALAIDAMRQLERHGGAPMMDRAFSGFVALPPPKLKKPWRHVLGDIKPFTLDSLSAAYRSAAMRRHPDRGGNTELMAELNQARDDALLELGGRG